MRRQSNLGAHQTSDNNAVGVARVKLLAAATASAVVVTGAWLTCAVVSCGGSASETPFPQPPIERELAARHEHANERDEVPDSELTSPPQAGTSTAGSAPAVSASASPVESSPPLPSPGPAF